MEGEPGRRRWVLDVDVNPGAPLGGSADQYFVGTFDGTIFKNDNPSGLVLWADLGKDFYATQSWSDLPATDSRRIWIAWMSTWQYANQDPTSPWRGMFTVPRSLRLIPTEEGLRLGQEPIEELKTLRGRHWSVPTQAVAGTVALHAIAGDALEIVAELAAGSAASFGLRVRKGPGEESVVGYDVAARELFVDRRRSGNVGFHGDFPGRHAAGLALADGRLRLHVFVDRSSVEVFAGGGRTVITERIFPDPASQGVEVWAAGGIATLVALDAWRLDVPAPIAGGRARAAGGPAGIHSGSSRRSRAAVAKNRPTTSGVAPSAKWPPAPGGAVSEAASEASAAAASGAGATATSHLAPKRRGKSNPSSSSSIRKR